MKITNLDKGKTYQLRSRQAGGRTYQPVLQRLRGDDLPAGYSGKRLQPHDTELSRYLRYEG